MLKKPVYIHFIRKNIGRQTAIRRTASIRAVSGAPLSSSGLEEAGCRRNRVVTFTAIRLRGPGFKPRPGQKLENENFCFRRTPAVVKACHPCRVRLIKTPLYKT